MGISRNRKRIGEIMIKLIMKLYLKQKERAECIGKADESYYKLQKDRQRDSKCINYKDSPSCE